MTTFDVVIPIGPNDTQCINDVVYCIQKNVIGYRNIYLISYDPSIQIENCITIDESIFPFKKDTIATYIGNTTRSGWYLQQLLKLYAGFVIKGILDHYLVIDCDIFFVKPTTFFKDQKPLYNTETEYHLPYFQHMKNLHPSLIRKVNMSGICHHMMFRKKILIQLFKLVETHHHQPFYQCFLKCIPENVRHQSGASEYEIYFNYLHIYHPNEFLIRKLSTENMKYHKDTIYPYDYISYHWYSRK